MKLFWALLINAIVIFIVSQLLSGVHIDNFITAIGVAAILGAINIFIRPLVLFFTLPLNVFTLGMFTFVINAVFILFVSYIVRGFSVDGFWWALLFSLTTTLVGSFIHLITRK